MIEKVEQTILKNGLINKGDTVLCAISGGADSVALFHCLYTLRNKLNFSLKAAHFNHGIRGKAADEDENFVRRLCDRFGIEAFFGHADVPSYAKEHGYTCEQAGRILRYDFFKKTGADKVATAHHMDDQAESIMMHIIRGSGTSGLCGMRYIRGNIIRPLLDVRRKDIENYLAEQGLTYCTDATNFIEDGTRNKLRLSIIPEITDKINPRFTESLCAMADIVRTDNDYLYAIASRALDDSKKDDGYLRKALAALDMPIRRRALLLAMQNAGAHCDIEQKHIELTEKLLTARTGAVLELPHIVAFNSYEKIHFATKEQYAEMSSKSDFCIDFSFGDIMTPTGRLLIEKSYGNSFEKSPNTVYMDADMLPRHTVIRTRKAGDKINPIGCSGSKKLKDYFIDKKIERHKRNMPLVCCGNDVLCISGITVARQVTITQDTLHMIKITYIPEDKNE